MFRTDEYVNFKNELSQYKKQLSNRPQVITTRQTIGEDLVHLTLNYLLIKTITENRKDVSRLLLLAIFCVCFCCCCCCCLFFLNITVLVDYLSDLQLHSCSQAIVYTCY